MARIAIITLAAGHANPNKLQTALENQGHTVTQIAQTSFASANSPNYDVIVLARCTISAANLATVRAYGKPIISEARHQNPVNLKIWSASTDSGAGTLAASSTFDSHGANGAYSGAVAVKSGVDYGGYYSGASAVGSQLATTVISGVSRVTGYCAAAGTLDLDGNALPAAIVIVGWMYTEVTTLTTDGEAILSGYVAWAIDNSPPAGTLASYALSSTSIENRITENGETTSYALYVQATTAVGLFDPGNIVDSGAGAPAARIDATGLTDGTLYYVGLRLTGAAGSTDLTSSATPTAPATDPTAISARVWYRADGTITASGGAVSQWSDESGNANPIDVVQASGTAQPTLEAAPRIGALPAVRMNDANDLLQADFSTIPIADIAQPTEMFFLVRKSTLNLAGQLFDGITGTKRHQVNIGATNLITLYAGTLITATEVWPDDQGHVLHVSFNGASSFARLDGKQILTGNPGAQAISGIRLGNGGPHWEIAEFALFTSALSETNRDKMRLYLANRMGSNSAPSAPSNVAATTPADLTSDVTWTAATDADSDPLQYEIDYWDGSSWNALAALQTFGTLEYEWDTSALPNGTAYKVRIRAHDGTVYGDYAESNTVTIDRPEPPGTPAISVAADSPTQATVTVDTPGSDATDHELYLAGAPTGLYDPANLYASGYGATPGPIVLTGLTPEATYYLLLRATNSEGGTNSDTVSVTMPEQPDPALTVGDITDESATLRLINIAVLEDAAEVEYETTTDADTTFAAPFDQSGTLTASTRFAHALTGLTSETAYRSRVRYRADSAAAWSDWLEAVWETEATPPPAPGESFWFAPRFGEPVRGTYCVTMGIETPREITSVEISDDYGDTWTELGTATEAADPDLETPTIISTAHAAPEWWEVCFDSTAYTDGVYLVRFTLDDASVVEHAGFVIDNAAAVTERMPFGDEITTLYSGIGFNDYTFKNRCLTPVPARGNWGKGISVWGPIDPDWVTYNHGVRVFATFLNMSPGSSGFSAYIPTEFVSMGMYLLDGQVEVRVTSRIMGGPCSPNEGYGSGTGHILIPSRGVAYSVPTLASGGVIIGRNCSGENPDTCGVFGGWPIMVEIYRPDPTGAPSVYRIHARFPPPRRATIGGEVFGTTSYPGHETGVIDELVDLGTPLDCGYTAFRTMSPGGFWGQWSMRFLQSYSIQLLEEAGECGTIPEPPPPTEPLPDDEEFTPGEPCSLKLFVYDDDRETVLWEVSTDRAHETPYLCLPEHYGEQEIDVVAGAASIGQVEVIVIDRRTVEGDQDSGWLTDRLADSIHGRRCRLLRYISLEHGWVVIADGPAGTPRMDESYSGYRWVIRDTRETERKAPAFTGTELGYIWPEGALYGEAGPVPDHYTTTLWPRGVRGGFGPIAATEPVVGHWTYSTVFGITNGDIDFTDHWSGTPGAGTVVAEEAVIHPTSEALLDSVMDTDSFGISVFRYPGVALLWRLAGSSDPFNVYIPLNYAVALPGAFTWPLATVSDGKLADDTPVRAITHIGAAGLGPDTPASGTDIEVMLLWAGAPAANTPSHVEGLTAGEFLRNLYDGVYSPLDPTTGEYIPTGIRYDEAALLEMTDPVRLRLVEPVKDVRDFAEKYIYGPTGWVPALDHDGRISPVSQIPPADYSALTTIDNDISEPQPSWDAGERIVNVLSFTYPRFYADPDSEAADGLSVREVTYEYRDEDSITRHGEHDVEYDGRAFGAVGNEAAAATEAETGAALAQLRRLYVFDRFRRGAQAIRVPVMREYTHQLRAGSWVNVDLSWFPDYVTRRRGMITGGQVVAIADLDCAWREALIEEAFPVDLGES